MSPVFGSLRFPEIVNVLCSSESRNAVSRAEGCGDWRSHGRAELHPAEYKSAERMKASGGNRDGHATEAIPIRLAQGLLGFSSGPSTLDVPEHGSRCVVIDTAEAYTRCSAWAIAAPILPLLRPLDCLNAHWRLLR